MSQFIREDITDVSIFPLAETLLDHRQNTGPDFKKNICKHKNDKSKYCITVLCEGVHLWPVDSPHKGWVMREAFPCYDVTMVLTILARRVRREGGSDATRDVTNSHWFSLLQSSGVGYVVWGAGLKKKKGI